MKTGMKMLTVVGAALAAGAIAATPMAAFASDGDVDAAVFVGQTTSLTPVLLVGGSGSYQFSTLNTPAGPACVGVSTDVDAGQCTISSGGTYDNVVCGTGDANGTATTTEPDGASDTTNVGILFVSGLGLVTSGPTHIGPPPSIGGIPGSVVGVVQLIPSSPATNPQCVTAFTVIGVAVLTS